MVSISKKIAVLGQTRGIGTTHLCLMLCHFFCNYEGRSVAYIEFNSTHQVHAMHANKPTRSYYNLHRIDFYPDVTFLNLQNILGKGYDFYIFDMGVINPNTLPALAHTDYCLVYGSISSWRSELYHDYIINNIPEISNYQKKIAYLACGCSKRNLANFRRQYQLRPLPVPSLDNPFQFTSQDWEKMEDLVSHFL